MNNDDVNIHTVLKEKDSSRGDYFMYTQAMIHFNSWQLRSCFILNSTRKQRRRTIKYHLFSLHRYYLRVQADRKTTCIVKESFEGVCDIYTRLYYRQFALQ